MSLWNNRAASHVNANEKKGFFVVLEYDILRFTETPLYLIQLIAVHVSNVCVSGRLGSFFLNVAVI